MTSIVRHIVLNQATLEKRESLMQMLNENEISKRQSFIIEIVSKHYERAQIYTTVVIAGSYVAFFTAWSGLQAEMNIQDRVISIIAILFSLSVFGIWEIYKMLCQAWLMKLQLEAANMSVEEFSKKEQDLIQKEKSLTNSNITLWYTILIWTILPALIAFVSLIQGALNIL